MKVERKALNLPQVLNLREVAFLDMGLILAIDHPHEPSGALT